MIYTSKNIASLRNLPILDEYQLYLYVMLNNAGNIKIGQTRNIVQRLQSLSGSNGGGYHITKLYVSPSSYVLTLERAFHEKYNKYRINGTEWFDGKELTFDEVVEEIEKQMNTEGYKTCNDLRKETAEKKREEDKIKAEKEKEEEKLNEKTSKKGRKKK